MEVCGLTQQDAVIDEVEDDGEPEVSSGLIDPLLTHCAYV
jgi:hypothetical protein